MICHLLKGLKEKREEDLKTKVRGGGLEAKKLLAALKAKNKTFGINDESQDPEGPCCAEDPGRQQQMFRVWSSQPSVGLGHLRDLDLLGVLRKTQVNCCIRVFIEATS